MMIIDEYERGRDRMERNIGNDTGDWDAAKKSAVHAAKMAYAGQYSFQFIIPISASEDQIKKLTAAIGEIARTTEPLQSPGL